MGVFSPAAFAQGAGLSFALSTPDGRGLQTVPRGLFDSFFEGSLDFDDFTEEFATVTGPMLINGAAVSLSYTWAPDRLPLARRLILETGQVSARLPDGIGIFRDPARLTAQYLSLAAEVDLVHAFPLTTAGDLRLSLTGGAVASLSRARLRSALLDVESRGVSRHPYLRLELEAAPLRDLQDMRLYSTVTAYRDGLHFVRIGARLQF